MAAHALKSQANTRTGKTMTATTAAKKPATRTRSTSAKKAAQTVLETEAPKAKPEVKSDYSYLAEKDPTALHIDFAAWLQEVTGLPIDLKTVQAVTTLRMEYQRSERNQASLKVRRDAAEAKKVARAEAKTAKEKAELARLQAKFGTEQVHLDASVQA